MRPIALLSREYNRSKPFIDALEAYVDKVICQSFIEFEFLDIPSIPDAQWLFFYSQKGVEAFHKVVKEKGWKIDHNIAAFGPRTAHYLNQLGYSPQFIGTGSGSSTAKEFESVIDGKRVSVIQGLHSKDSLRKNFKNPSILDSLVVYKNIPRAVIIEENPKFLCFTSPMNLKTFFSVNSLSHDQEVICIGASTAEMALEQGLSKFHISKETSITSLADTIISLLSANDNGQN